MKWRKKGASRHHIVPKSDGGKGLPDNTMRLPNDIHNQVHYLDRQVDPALVKKDYYYYLQIIGAAYKTKER